jgi:hypothetical protein
MTALTEREYRLPALTGPRPGREKGPERRDNLNPPRALALAVDGARSAIRKWTVSGEARDLFEISKAMRQTAEGRFDQRSKSLEKFVVSAQAAAASLFACAIPAGAGVVCLPKI